MTWHKKEDYPRKDEWILVERDNPIQPYKVFKYDGRNGLVTGNYPNPSYTFQNYDVTPIIRWAYINELVK